MSKRIGIVTTFKANNYGAELQAYATQRKLRDMGYDAELIDYLFYKNRKHRYSKGSEPWMRFPWRVRVNNYLLYRIIGPMLEIIGNRFSTTMRQRTHNFLSFHAQHSSMSKTYYSQEELYSAIMDYDVYCVGSDQVWNPNTATSIAPHFLTFAPRDKRRISYASSFGVSSLPENCLGRYREGLMGLDSISCRESQGVKLVKELTGRDATHVLDPTLLLDAGEWETVSSYDYCLDNRKYILVYNIVELSETYQLARRISRETGWPILRLCKRGLFVNSVSGVRNVPMAGPADFLGLIARAGMFLTNSFHGCAFAINMQTPFWALVDKRVSNNSRIESLLSLTGLHSRLLTTESDVDAVNYSTNIDYTHAHEVLAAEREKSLDYLHSAIESDH